jgi:uncharacterized membrane protein
MKSPLLANIIHCFHILIVLFILIIPFTNMIGLLVVHVAFSLCLLVHWHTNENICALSVLEAYVRGVDRQTTFTHSFIAPIYDISSSNWSHICIILTIVLMYISFYKILTSKKLALSIKLCKQISKNPNTNTFIEYVKCFKPLFTL